MLPFNGFLPMPSLHGHNCTLLNVLLGIYQVSQECKAQTPACKLEISIAIRQKQPDTARGKTPYNEFSEAASRPTAEPNIPPVDLLTLLKAS